MKKKISERRRLLQSLGLRMEPGLRGLRLSWPEVYTLNSALVQVVKNCPRGSFVSVPLDRLQRRVARRYRLNSTWINEHDE